VPIEPEGRGVQVPTRIQCRPTVDSDQLRALAAGESVEISGDVITIRDASAKLVAGLVDAGAPLPVALDGMLLYAAGPSPPKPGQVVGSAGPTTTGRFEKYLPALFRAGIRGIIGKGELHGPIVDLFKAHGAIYFAAIGGLGALLGKRVVAAEVVAFPELGTEALHRFEVRDFPAVVIIDAAGNNFHEMVRRAGAGIDPS
jgi:fumarate hydratase subunit beta